jgi:hypothetical protein
MTKSGMIMWTKWRKLQAHAEFFRKPEWWDHLGNFMHRWEVNIEMGLEEIGSEGVAESYWLRML